MKSTINMKQQKRKIPLWTFREFKMIKNPIKLIFTMTLFSFSLVIHAQQDAKLEDAVKEQVQIQNQLEKAQTAVLNESEKSKALMDDIQITASKIESTKLYNAQLETLLKDQEQDAKNLNEQILSISETQRDVVPLMLEMISTLEKFISLDIPFLKEERADRVAKLKEMMNRSDVTTSEKYRRILEAYQIEMDFGRTIEAYRGLQLIGDQSTTVNFLRVGRMGLYYQTLDRKQTGQWSVSKKTWEKLDSDFESGIYQGIRIAKKEMAPDLIQLPLTTAEVTK